MQKVEGSNPFSRLLGNHATAVLAETPESHLVSNPAMTQAAGERGPKSIELRSTALRFLALACGLAALGFLLAVAASGSFDDQGRTVLPIDGSVQKVASYPGGGAILGTSEGTSGDGLARVAADGSIDRSFGVDGFVERYFTDVTVLPSGKVLVVGPTGENYGPAVTRLLPNGAADPSFGHGGEVEVALAGNRKFSAEALAIASAPGGKIVVSGSVWPGNRRYHRRAAMARLEADGSPDRSFGGDGVTAPLPSPPPSFGPVGVAPDGTIVAIVYAGLHAHWTRMVRIESDGSLDRSFGAGGFVQIGGLYVKPPVFPPLEEIAVLRDGRIVVGGTVTRTRGRKSSTWGIVARLLPSGRRDLAYGGDGVVRTHFEGSFYPDDIVVRPDGGAVLGGHVIARGRGSRLAIAGFEPNGRSDRRFGRAGRASVDFGEDAFGYGIALQPGGAILAFGEVNDGGDRQETIAARFEPRPPGSASFSLTRCSAASSRAGHRAHRCARIQPNPR
jgi:uncharacterized delta-60 repeat protein